MAEKSARGQCAAEEGRLSRGLRPTLQGRMGVRFDSSILARAIADRWGVLFDPIPDFRPPLAQENELLGCLTSTLRPTKVALRAHPDLKGMEFAQEECQESASLAMEAEKVLLRPQMEGIDKLRKIRAINTLCSSREFEEAIRAKDRRAQMRIALEACAIRMRAKRWESLGEDESIKRAQEEVQIARDMAGEYRKMMDAGADARQGAKQCLLNMRELSHEIAHAQSSDYELALSEIDLEHERFEQEKQNAEAELKAKEAKEKEAKEKTEQVTESDIVTEETILPPAGVQIDPDALPEYKPSVEIVHAQPDRTGEISFISDSDIIAPQGAAAQIPGGPGKTEHVSKPDISTSPQAQSPKDMKKEEKPELVFPFGNFASDNELEELLPPKTDGRDSIIERNALIRKTARTLLIYIRLGKSPDKAALCYRDALSKLGADPSKVRIVRCAEEIVDKYSGAQGKEKVKESARPDVFAPLNEPARAGPDHAKALLEKLDQGERELVAGALMQKTCDSRTIMDFLSLHPGSRDLLLRKFVLAHWKEGWREDIQRLRKAYASVYETCGLKIPDEKEKLEAIRDPALLSDSMKGYISSIMDVAPDRIRPEHLEGFRIWASADPDAKEGKDALGAYWSAHSFDYLALMDLSQKAQSVDPFTEKELVMLGWILSKDPEKLTPADQSDVASIESAAKKQKRRQELWFDSTKEERRSLHLRDRTDLLCLGSFLHKMRFSKDPVLSSDEESLSQKYFGMGRKELEKDDGKRASLIKALTDHTRSGGQEFQKSSVYYPEILSLYRSSLLMGANALLEDAKKEDEYALLLDYLGVKTNRADGMLDQSRGASRAKMAGKKEDRNDDSYSSAKLTLKDGSKVLLDMVADGMGGHDMGESAGKTNGQIASAIAKDVFDISCLAGWIRTPEDARKIILMADIAVVMEQIRMREQARAKEDVESSWRIKRVELPSKEEPRVVEQFEREVRERMQERLADLPAVQENNMGSTFTITMQKGRDFWGIHCGDSDWKILRDGKILHQSAGHSREFAARLEVEAKSRAETLELWAKKGLDVRAMDGAHLLEFEKQVKEKTEEQMAGLKAVLRQNLVSSVIGVMPAFVHINNAEKGYAPMQLEGSDILLVMSDGISVPVCDHELGIVAERCKGDLKQAQADLISLAEERRRTIPHKTLCQCGEREGKNDDKTLIMRYASDGFSEAIDITGPEADHKAGLGTGGKADGEAASSTAEAQPAPDAKRAKSVSGEFILPAQSEKPLLMFDSQKDRDGNPLAKESTRYLDDLLHKTDGKNVVSKLAEKLNILPRDLEIIAFYVYSGFGPESAMDPKIAMDPHQSHEGQELIRQVAQDLRSPDAKRILLASYYIYRLKDTGPEPQSADQMSRSLWKAVQGMDPGARYSLLFNNAAYTAAGPKGGIRGG